MYNGDKEDEGYDLLRFLNTIMYPHKEDFMDTVSEYIDYSENEELWKEVKELSTIEEIRLEGMKEELEEEMREKAREEIAKAIEKGIEKARKEVIEEAKKEALEEARKESIQIMILDNLEERIPKERILIKLQKRFNLTEEKAEQYYKQSVANV